MQATILCMYTYYNAHVHTCRYVHSNVNIYTSQVECTSLCVFQSLDTDHELSDLLPASQYPGQVETEDDTTIETVDSEPEKQPISLQVVPSPGMIYGDHEVFGSALL